MRERPPVRLDGIDAFVDVLPRLPLDVKRQLVVEVTFDPARRAVPTT